MMERIGHVGWVLAHLDDLDSDFSVFHRVDDFRAMPAPRFFALAARLPVYGGVMTERVRQATEPDELDEVPIPEGAKLVPLAEFADMIESG